MSNPPAAVSPSRLKLQVSAGEDAALVRLSGRLTAADTATLKDQVKSLISQARRIVLDLTDLTFMDSSGLGAIVGLYVSAKTAGHELQLVNLSQQIRELLRFTRVLSLFEAAGQYPVKMP
jgi:anti-sigma B factor antagonist